MNNNWFVLPYVCCVSMAISQELPTPPVSESAEFSESANPASVEPAASSKTTPAADSPAASKTVPASQEANANSPGAGAAEGKTADKASTEDDAAILASLGLLPVEELQGILQAYVDLGNDTMALAVAEELLKRNPSDLHALNTAITAAMNQKNHDHAAALAENWTKNHPNDPQGYLALADAYGDGTDKEISAKIAAALTKARELSPSGTFKRQEDLANALEKSGQWQLAHAEWSQLCRSHGGVGPDTVAYAKYRIEEIETKHMASIQGDLSWLKEPEGKLLSLTETFLLPLNETHRLSLGGYQSWLYESQPKSFLGLAGQHERQETSLALRSRLARGWESSVSAGAAFHQDTKVTASAALIHQTENHSVFTLGAEYNQRANDGLSLVFVDGRQHVGYLRTELPLTKSLYLEAFGFIRQVEVDDFTLGDGYGADVTVAYSLSDKNPNVVVGYEWEWRDFSFDRSASKAQREAIGGEGAEDYFPEYLVLPQVNRHGIFLEASREFGDLKLGCRLAAGYRFETDLEEYSACIHADYRIGQSTAMRASYEYYSSPSSGFGDGSSHLLTLSLRTAF